MMRGLAIAFALLACLARGQDLIIATRTNHVAWQDRIPETLATNCMIWLPVFSNAAAGVYADAGPQHLDATQTNTADRPGATNSYFTFTGFGATQFLNISTNVAAADAITVAMWMAATQDVIRVILSVSQSAAATNFWYFGVGDGATSTLTNELLLVGKATNGATEYTSAWCTPTRTLLLDGAWHSVVLVQDTTITKLYVDATQQTVTVGIGSDSGDMFAGLKGIDNVMLGARKLSGAYSIPYTGKIDGFGIYNRAWTTNEIKTFHRWRTQ